MRTLRTYLACLLWVCLANAIETRAATPVPAPELVQVRRIWDAAPHNAFTDLVRWEGKFYCAFREGQGHAGDLGKLRILASLDGDRWQSVGLLAMETYDLRDAALSVTPDGRLMVMGGAQQVRQGIRQTGTFVSFSEDGDRFSSPKIVVPLGRWLWRVTWLGDAAFGVSYGANQDRTRSALHRTRDGIRFETVSDALLAKGGWPTEARIRFDAEGTAYCLHRRDGEEGNTAYVGRAEAPYKDWEWHDLGVRFGGPNFLELPGGRWIGAGRLYDGGARTEIVELDVAHGKLRPLLRLPSGGDTSYPGMVWHDGVLWVSYYSSHEGKASIYLAQVRFPDAGKVTAIDDRLELFVDRQLVDTLDGASLRLHAPRPEEAVLKFDKPWEGAFCGYATVIKDGDRYHLYYRGLPAAGRDGTDAEVTCYAESQDGIRWQKPDLGLYEIRGTRKNNVVLAGQTPASHNFSPFLDANPEADPAQRFKALGGTAGGLRAFVSADGVHWKPLRDQPVFTQGVFDSQNVSFYSQAEQRYLCYFRTWTEGGYRGFRTVSRSESVDFVHWTPPVEMTFGDRPHEHLYTNQTSPYFRSPHLYLGVAARFMPGRRVLREEEAERIGVNPDYFGDCSDAVLLSSRGGSHYDRTFMESFIRPGLGLQNWVSRTNYPALGVVPTGDEEISLYLQKNYGQPTAYLQRYSLRTDGFASVQAGFRGGEMRTKPLTFSTSSAQPQLVLNYSTSAAGSVHVELQDASGEPYAGFSAEECETLIGDCIAHAVRWRNEPSLKALEGKTVRLRFMLKDADLYSFRFHEPAH